MESRSPLFQLRWVWASQSPDISVRPCPSMHRSSVSGKPPPRSTAAISPSRTSTSAAKASSSLPSMTWTFLKMMFCGLLMSVPLLLLTLLLAFRFVEAVRAASREEVRY